MNARERHRIAFTLSFSLLVAACTLLALWVYLLPAQAATVANSPAQYQLAPLTSPTPCGQGSWQIVPSPSYNSLAHYLRGITAISANDAWAVGTYSTESGPSQALFEHWDGTQWSLVPGPASSNSIGMSAVSAVSSDDVWAVQSGGPDTALSMHWDGNDWSVVSTPNISTTSQSLFGVSALATNDVWSVGRLGSNLPGGTFALHWDGSQWTYSPFGKSDVPDNYPSALFGVAAISHDDVWAVGARVAPTSTTHPLLMHYSSGQWTQLPTIEEFGELWGVSPISSNDIWAVGYHYDQSQLRAITRTLHWDGQNWSIIPSPNLPDGIACFLTSVVARSSNDVWAVGYSSPKPNVYYTLTMYWDGKAWAIVDSPTPSSLSMFRGVAAVGEDLFAVGYYLDSGIFRSFIERYHADPCPATATSTPVPPTINPTFTMAPTNTTVPVPPSSTSTLSPPTATSQPASTNTALPESTPTTCPVSFSDVPPTNVFYAYVRCLACRGILGGYDDGTFRPNSLITRGQIAKVVSNAAALDQDPGSQMYEDVPISNPFYIWVNRLSDMGYMSGYPCGGEGEPCGSSNLPYFRPFGNATRGQIAKILSNAVGISDDPGTQIFNDVPPSNPFYLWIQRVALHNIMSGYDCGGPGEPCCPDCGPYFRTYNNATRGQTAKIVSIGFFPECAP